MRITLLCCLLTDAVSKQGIVNAAIRSYEGSTSYTNKSGYYVWDNGMIPCTSGGIYDFTASADGYEPLTQYIDVQPCVEGMLDFKLQPTGTPTPIPGRIYGSVVDKQGNPLLDVRVTLKGKRTKVKKETTSDASGYFAFEGLEKDTYKITAKKKGYRKSKQSVKLEEGEAEEGVEIVMKLACLKDTKEMKIITLPFVPSHQGRGDYLCSLSPCGRGLG